MTRISHELPKGLMTHHDIFGGDYLFALLHKAVEDRDYYQFIIDYKAAGGTVFLDNSCYELGESMDNELLHDYFNMLKPDIFLLPDVLGSGTKTMERTFEFLDKYPDTASSAMAVAQGSSRQAFYSCYEMFASLETPVAMIGIPFVFSWLPKDPFVQAMERVEMLYDMSECDIIRPTIKHHLLGTWLPAEFAFYRDYDWIHSLDTSNPIMATIEGTSYKTYGLTSKPKTTFDDVYDMDVVDIDTNLLYHNVKIFRRIVNGG